MRTYHVYNSKYVRIRSGSIRSTRTYIHTYIIHSSNSIHTYDRYQAGTYIHTLDTNINSIHPRSEKKLYGKMYIHTNKPSALRRNPVGDALLLCIVNWQLLSCPASATTFCHSWPNAWAEDGQGVPRKNGAAASSLAASNPGPRLRRIASTIVSSWFSPKCSWPDAKDSSIFHLRLRLPVEADADAKPDALPVEADADGEPHESSRQGQSIRGDTVNEACGRMHAPLTAA